ncbi:hypothetical protein F5Y13DRAFT_186699 [Hypoxylon sp. FL1857]|nr:hypothetical protein F5Y13DRAFT_186699 [Hypoxylon sp. FL1857]
MENTPENTSIESESDALSEEFAGLWSRQLLDPTAPSSRNKRHVLVKRYRRQLKVDIWFNLDGRAQATKKGISLTVKEFEALVSLIPQIQAEIQRREGNN